MDPRRLAEYAELAGSAIEAGGGRFIARGIPVATFEEVEGQRLHQLGAQRPFTFHLEVKKSTAR